MSLLRAHGHVQAHHYPICKLWEEVKAVKRRVNAEMRTKAVAMLEALVTSQAGEKTAKKAVKAFNEFLEDTFGDGEDH